MKQVKGKQRAPKRAKGGDENDNSGDEDDANKSGPGHDEKETYEVFKAVPAEEVAKYGFSRLIGLDSQIERLKQTIVLPLKYKNAFKVIPQGGLRPNILLYGPAGTGKTDIAMSLAKESGLPIYKVSASQIQSSFQSRSKRNFAVLLETAEKENPDGAIVFFDEADTLLGSSSSKEGHEDTSIVNVFKEKVNVGQLKAPKNIIFVAATNFPEKITDVGILSRFSFKMFIGLPSSSSSALRSTVFIRKIDELNRPRCGDIKDHFVQVPEDTETREDLENLLFFYTPRELDFIASSTWRFVDVSPFHIEKFLYDPIDKCTNIYQSPEEGLSIWTLVRKREIAREGGMGATRRSATASNNAASAAAANKEELAVKSESQLLRIDQLSPEHQENIRWEYIEWSHVVETLKDPQVFSSVTLESLVSFYRYARYTLRDTTGAYEILQLLNKGRKGVIILKSKTFNTPEFNERLPSWELSPEDIRQLESRF